MNFNKLLTLAWFMMFVVIVLTIGFGIMVAMDSMDRSKEVEKKGDLMDQCLVESRDGLKCCLQTEYRIPATCYREYN